MGKSKRDWRNGYGDNGRSNGKGKKEKNYAPYEEETKMENTERQQTNKQGGYTRKQEKIQEPVEIHPVAQLLMNIFRDQIRAFLTCNPEDRPEEVKKLFTAGDDYPSRLHPSVGSELDKYLIYQLERRVRLDRKDVHRLSKMSTTIILIDEGTNMPAFLLTAFITPSGDGNVKVCQYNENGIIPRNTIFWDSRQDNEESNG